MWNTKWTFLLALIPFLLAVAVGINFFREENLEQSSEIFVTTPAPTPAPTPRAKIVLDVPFVAQAPLGAWSDPRQQDGCEEAVSFMVWLWATERETPVSLEAQEKEIIKISDWEAEKYGDYHDTSVRDTLERIIKGYYLYDRAEVRYTITIGGIKNELYNGNIVIVPANGRALNNPNFTPPGPDRHMLLIRGYDPETREFLTNDNGTRRGENYRYSEKILFGAIRDYPTGNHLPIEKESKVMIVVKK